MSIRPRIFVVTIRKEEPSLSWSCSARRGISVEPLEATLPPHAESLPGNGAKVRKAEPRDTLLMMSLEHPDSAVPEALSGLSKESEPVNLFFSLSQF